MRTKTSHFADVVMQVVSSAGNCRLECMADSLFPQLVRFSHDLSTVDPALAIQLNDKTSRKETTWKAQAEGRSIASRGCVLN